MPKPHILIIGANILSLYQHRLELIRQLQQNGYKISVAAPIDDDAHLMQSLGVQIIDMPVQSRGTNPIKDLSLILRIIKILKQTKPNVVLTFYTKTNIYGGIACRITNTPYITNITGLGSALTNPGPQGKIMTRLYAAAVKKAAIVFFQNQANRQFFKTNNIKTQKSQLLPGSGVSLSRFTPLPYPSPKTTQFVFISRILKQKGIDEYLAAATAIRQQYPNTIFHVVGPADNNYLQKLNTLHQNQTIIYHGKLPDIRPILAQTHCTILPSYYPEGMANVLLESAASARPIITTTLPGCRETIDNLITGYTIRQQDPKDLTDKILKFIQLPHNQKIQMGLNGRAKMQRQFDRQIIVNAYLTQIQLLLPHAVAACADTK